MTVTLTTGPNATMIRIHDWPECGGVLTREPDFHHNPDGSIHSFTGLVIVRCDKCGLLDFEEWQG